LLATVFRRIPEAIMWRQEYLRELLRPYYLRWIYFRHNPNARPAHFAECWRYPNAPLGELTSPAATRPGIVFYPMNDWHTRFQRTQQLATALSRAGYRCLYVNPNLGRQFEQLRYQSPEHRIGILGENLYELHVRLPREPVFHHRRLTAAETTIVQGAVAAALDELRMSPAVQVVSFPLWFEAASALRHARSLPIVYDCHDLLQGFGNVDHELVAAEERQLPDADLVLFSSERLREHFAAQEPTFTGRTLMLRNAVDFEQFSAAQETAAPSTAVYTGALAHWFDTDAVRAAARATPGCRISLIGNPETRQARDLASEPNIHLVGEVPYDRLPTLVGQARVGLIPFKINALTLATNPIKLYEYFSLGMPVVSTRLPEVEQFRDLVYIASDSAGFAAALQAALLEDDPERRLRRKAVAREESWGARASLLSAEFQHLSQDISQHRTALL
jgi:glycosyltransferase involved in cell wall biosynthesis